ncbi:hypothetical protein Cycma_0993 [Cyclobacterium marinum DSM 745]|uniref:Uncharacterized protein n=1 Tax=Cyclobacterium marinum (strain ATCC 25205 / DSM 745 / LMG 13164 / NCIMB 1802) TaxID=880070 RepID=G0IUK2_CYCMS|nr:hypothetical protein Cycma_0993 [Cyclobacterium marinum DSM 745]
MWALTLLIVNNLLINTYIYKQNLKMPEGIKYVIFSEKHL